MLRVSQPTIARDLDGLFTVNKPPGPKGGRPRDSGKTPKLSVEARVSPIRKITEPTIDPATLSLSAHAATLCKGDRVVRAAEWDAERTHLKARIVELEAEVEKLRRATPVKLTHSGKFAMDREVFRYIKARLHPDVTTDSVEGRRLHDAFTAFMNLPITTIGEEERREAFSRALIGAMRRWSRYRAPWPPALPPRHCGAWSPDPCVRLSSFGRRPRSDLDQQQAFDPDLEGVGDARALLLHQFEIVPALAWGISGRTDAKIAPWSKPSRDHVRGQFRGPCPRAFPVPLDIVI